MTTETLRPWRVLINPPQYTDSDDRGYGDSVMARDEKHAVELACRACEACNDFDEGAIDSETVDVWECEPDWRIISQALITAGDIMAQMIEEAESVHIYDFQNEAQPEDCNYRLAREAWGAARLGLPA